MTWASAIGVEPAVGRLGEVGLEVGRQRAAVAAEAGQERRLRLADDVAGHAHHHVVEAAVPEVILDPGSARPGDRSVDDVELAVVGAAELVLPEVEALALGEEAVAVGREHVVDHDLRARGGQAREHRPRRLVRPGAEAVDDHPHVDTLGQLPLEQRRHPQPHVALPPAEHEDVHGGARALDVREDAREEVVALDPGLDRRRRRPREVQRRVARPRPFPCGERGRRGLRTGRGHRVGRWRPARPLPDAEHAPVDAGEQRRSRQRKWGRGSQASAPTARAGLCDGTCGPVTRRDPDPRRMRRARR